MALTDTTASKKFIAGAPDIILKGDYRRNKPDMEMASAPGPYDDYDDIARELFGKPYKDLTPDEMDLMQEELQRLMQKFMADGGRVQYGLGSLVKSVGKAVKGVVKGAGKILKSPAGLLALNFAPMLIPGGASTFFGGANAKFNIGSMLGLKEGADAMNALKVGGAGAVITGLLAEREQQEGESDMDYAQRRAQVNDQLKVQFSRLYPKGENETPEDYDIRINALVEGADDQTVDVGNMAEGGRVGLASGANERYEEKIKELMDKGLTRELAEALVLSELSPEAFRIIPENKAEGGRIGRKFGSDKLVEQASGIEGLPVNVNSKGVKELDMRETGGFIPPVGVKEKADDIPAMLSNNEFVFTADAVRAAGGGSINKGAQRMYDLMKNLESKVV